MIDNNDTLPFVAIGDINDNNSDICKLNIRELPFSAKAQITWSFFWRAMIVAAGGLIVAAISGGIAGVIIGLFLSEGSVLKPDVITVIRVVGGCIGLIVALFSWYPFIQWLLSTKLGTFRLLLIRAEP